MNSIASFLNVIALLLYVCAGTALFKFNSIYASLTFLLIAQIIEFFHRYIKTDLEP